MENNTEISTDTTQDNIPAPDTVETTNNTEVNTQSEQTTDWRQGYLDSIKDDAERTKKQNVLSRFASPEALMDSYFNAQNKIRTTQTTPQRPNENSTEEEIAAYREANNVPETPDGYEYNLPEGLIVGDDDKVLLDGFMELAHSHNIPQEAVDAIVNSHFTNMEKQNQMEVMQFEQDFITAQEILKGEMGVDYERNINHLATFMQDTLGDDWEVMEGAIGADGVPLMSNPAIIRKLSILANQTDPVARVMPQGMRNVDSVDSEIKKIESMFSNPEERRKYNSDPKLQSRYRELLAAKNKMG